MIANPLYLLVGNRTWLVSTALAFIQLILILLFIIFFKQFKAKKEVPQKYYHFSCAFCVNEQVNGTIRTDTVNEEDKKELLQFEDMNETVEAVEVDEEETLV